MAAHLTNEQRQFVSTSWLHDGGNCERNWSELGGRR